MLTVLNRTSSLALSVAVACEYYERSNENMRLLAYGGLQRVDSVQAYVKVRLGE